MKFFFFWSEPLMAGLSTKAYEMFYQGLKWQPLIMCFCDLVYTQHYIYAHTVSPEKRFPSVGVHQLNTRARMNKGSSAGLCIIGTGLCSQR